MSRIKNIVLFIFTVGLIVSVLGQNKSDLEKRKKNTINELKRNSELYEKVKKDKEIKIVSVQILSNKIVKREKLIKEIDEDIDNITGRLETLETKIEEVKLLEAQKKRELSKVVYNLYKRSRNTNKMMFILSSGNINESYKRISYLKNYTVEKNKKIHDLLRIKADLQNKISSYNREKKNKESTLSAKSREVKQLESEKVEKETLIKNLTNKEKDLLKKIKEQKRIAEELEKKINDLNKELSKANNLVYNKLTPREKVISKNFSTNKGKLPWPTEKGVISSYFGKHQHPVLKDVYINNNGIDITTETNEEVRAIFEGVVTKIFTIKGYNYVIIIRHGNYLSVYQNVDKIVVKIGEIVKTKQKIGNVSADNNVEVSVLHFEIWEELKKQNPTEWLSN